MNDEKKTGQQHEEITGNAVTETTQPTGEASTEAEQPEDAAGGTGAEVKELSTDSVADVENSPEPQTDEPKKPKKKSALLQSQRLRRGGISTLFTAGFLAVIILLNVVVSMLGERFPSIHLDLTSNGLNTLSQEAIEIVDSVTMPTTITILGAEADVRDNVLYAGYGMQYSQVAVLTDKIKERNPKITVQYVDLDRNPTYASSIGEANLSTGSVVVSTERRHHVLQITDLFDQQVDYTTGQTASYSMVGNALASAISRTNSERVPVVAFATGHDEIYDTTALQTVLKGANFDTVSFNILTEPIPENAQMIMLATPTKDYTQDELKKLDAFLENSELKADRSLLISFYPSQDAMPNLSSFLKEWGIEVPRSMLVETNMNNVVGQADASFILARTGVDSTVDFGSDTTDYGYVLMPQASPINLLFTSRDGVTTRVLAESYDSTYVVDANTTEESMKNPSTSAHPTLVLAQKNMQLDGKTYHQNVVVAGSSAMFADGIINASVYGNGSYTADLVRYATGETENGTGIAVTPIQTNKPDINLSQAAATMWGLGVFTFLIPVCVLGLGFAVYLKRRHL